MIGDHTQGLVFQIGRGSQFRCRLDQRLEQVDLVIGMHVLQHRRDTLQAHAGVHAGCGQRLQAAVGLTVELHEHVVPDFDEAVAIFIRAAGRTTRDMRAVVVENLGTRPAGTGIGHLPEVIRRIRRTLVVADADDPIRRNTYVLVPDLKGFVVGVIDRHQQAFFGQLPDLGQQLPGPADGVLLEVVAKTEVAQHLEKRVMPRGVTDLIQIVVLATGAHAALARHRPRVAAFVAAQKHILELHHARVGEQQGRIVARHQRAGGHDLVSLRLEKLEEVLADVVTGFHACGASKATRRA